MDRRRAAGALLALAACVACSTAAPTASNQTALELLESPTEGCYYNFQHYGEGDRIMTNEPCLNCTCHNRMLMCYLRVCPFTKPIGQDCTIEKRADQCCPIVTCPDVPVDLLTSTSTSSPAEYGGTGLGKVDKYGCSINGKYFPEGSKVPPTPNKPCEHCYCIRNMTTCVMQECTLHVDGCTPIYHKDVCCPVRYSCDHQEDETLLLDDMTTTVRPTPGFLLTTTTMAAVTQMSQDCVHDDQIFADGALIKTEKACEHCYCMKGDIVCVVQECGTPMENEGKNCTSLAPRQGQCCPDTYICEGDELISDVTTGTTFEDLTTLSPPRRVEGSGYRNEPDEPYTEIPTFEGSGEEQATTLYTSHEFTSHKHTPEIIDEVFEATEEPLKPSFSTIEPDKGQNTVPYDFEESTPPSHLAAKTTLSKEEFVETQSSTVGSVKDSDLSEVKTTASDYYSTERGSAVFTDKELMMTTETAQRTDSEPTKAAIGESEVEKETATSFVGIEEVTTVHEYLEPSSSESSTLQDQENDLQTADISKVDETDVTKITTTEVPKEVYENENNNRPEQDPLVISDMDKIENIAPSTTSKTELFETTSINPVENEIDEDILPPGRIPGEGDCLLNGITYKNNTSVPNINNCHSSCKCFSSIVKCDPIICSPPPDVMDNMNDCQPIYDTPDACCPTYVCHSRETIPPESHSQMSGTESPRPSSEKPVSDCKGEQCPALEKSPELCNSEECQVQEQVKECENGLCVEQTELESDKSPPQKYPEDCVGDNCFLPPSDDKCIDGKCQQPIVTDDICNNENGCQTPEVALCNGPNCEPDMNIPKDEKPEISQPSCEGSSECDSTVTKHTAPSECSDESCRRKEQSQHESPQKCSGSNCNIPEEDTHDLTNDTTDIPSIDVSYKESTTEKIEESFSKSPQPEVTLIDQEAEKVTQDEVVATEKQETLELTTEKSIDVTVNKVEDHVTENQESPTEPSELHVTKSDSTVTETYREPDTGDDSFIPQAYSTQSEEQVTQSIEHITKEISTEMPLMYEEHSTVISTEVESSTQERFTESVKTPATSTEILQTILNHIDENKESETNTEINEEITQEYEIHTETPNIHPPDIPKTDTKQETDTESLLITTTHLDETNLDKDIITERQPEIGITESSLPVSHDTYTEQHVGYTGKEGDVMTTESYIMTTDNLIPIDQTSETQETKINAPVTNKVYDDTQTKEVITENPNLYTEKAPFEPQSQDHFITDKDFSQKTTQGTPSENVDMESTVSSIKDQQEYAGLPDIQPVPDKQDASEETQEYMTSTITPDTYVTLPSITGEKQETQKPEIPATEQVAINPTEHFDEPTETSISQDFAMKESSTNHPEISDTTLQGITNADEIKTSTDYDTVEQGTKAPEENFQDDTTQKESAVTKDIAEETEEDDIKFKPISEDAALETTISSIISDKDQEISTKYEDEEATGYIDGSTLVPEKAPTFDKSTLAPNRRVESETAPTESSEKHTLGTNVSDETPTTFKPTEDENVDKESTETIVTYSDKHVFDITSAAPESSEEKEGITASTIDQKAEEMPFTVPEISETHEQSFEETDTVPSKEVVTEQIGSDVKGDTDKQIFTSTEYPDVHETTVENIYTHTSETQSHDEDTKLVPELHTEIPTTSVHLEKDEKNTDTPMSLVTESEVHEMTPIKSEDSSIKITLEKTTQMSVIDESSEVTMQSPGYHEMESPQHSTESSDIPVSEKEDVYDTPSPIHHEKENKLESPSTIAAVEYTTLKNTDIQKESFTTSPIIEDVVVDIVTETVEQQAPTTKYPEVLHEFSTMNPLIDNSGKSSTIQQQEGSPRPLEINTAVTDITFEQESNVQSTDQTINIGQETSTQSKITETVLEDQTSVYDKNVQEIQEQHEHTTLPEFLTTKYVETSDSVNEKETTENKSDKEGMSTFAYEENVTIHNLPNTEPSVSNAVLLDHEKSTTLTQMLDAEDLTTPSYDDSNTIKGDDISNAHISTTGIITTESSIDEEDHRRTLSTAVETEAEVLTTVKEEIPFKGYTTELPEINKTDLLEDSDKIDITSTDTPVKEIITLAPAHEHQKPEYATSIPQSEDEVLLQTDGNVSYGDQDLTVATESINKHITEVQYTTDKPLLTEQDLQTELPTKDKDEVTDRTTVQVDLVNIPDEKVSEEIPPQHIVPHESGTESLPTVTETESSSILETGTLEPHKTYTESSDLSETEKSVFEEMATSISDETVTSVPKETETSLPIETEVTVPKEIDTSISIETETSVPTETETSISLDITTKYSSPVEAVTETLVHKETEPSVAIEMGTETSVSTETQTSIPLKTDISVPVQTETEMSVLKETYDLSSEPTEPTVSKVTDASQKETETTQEYTEPESSIDQIKDEKLPEGVPPTIEPTYSSSGTTPYLVELQEHTNKLNEDISSVIPPDTLTTKASEIYQTERGDQPVEYVDQSTQKEIHEVQTESTLAETVEKQTSSPQQQPTDFQTSTSVHEEIPHKTQEVTEEILPALVDTPPEDNIPTVLTEEQSSTTIPTVSFTSEHEKQTTLESTSSEKTPEQQDIQETIAPEDELLPTITKATTSRTMDTTTQVPTVQDKVTKPEEKPEPYPSTTGPEVHKPGVNEIQPTEEIPPPDFPPSGTSGYGQEPDYVEEDQAFGPGTCRYGGKVYVSAQQIPRDDPCDFCFCFRSDIICLQQSCPPPIQGCHEEPIQGFCCPRYECPVSMATTLNVTTTTTTTTTTLPPHFLPHAYKGAAQRRGCQIKGHTYKVGDVVRASSGPCLHCTCGGDGQMKCDPKACTPEPMLRQMIAAAVSAKRRR